MVGNDIIIRNGCLVDGSGAEGFVSDIAVKNGKITEIEKEIRGPAEKMIDASGKIVSPGFIDIHTHCDREIFNNDDTRKALNYLFQGVTLVIGGNCGLSTMGVSDFSRQITDSSIGINAGMLIGHNRVRDTVMGSVNRFADDFELEEMKKIVANEMEKGAFGISTGLIYIPGAYCNTREIVELCKVVRGYGGIYTTHLRNEADGIMEAIDEASEIGRESDIPVHISHLKVMGKSMWGKSVDALAKIAGLQQQGLDVTFDQYPYNATSTMIDAFSPAWALEGSLQDIQIRLEDSQTREKILEVVTWNMKNDRGGGNPENVVVCSSPNRPDIEGKSLAQLTEERGKNPTCENASQIVLELIALGDVICTFKCLGEKDVETVMKADGGIVASDGFVMEFDRQKPHPRSYGTFPRVLSKYVRDKKLLSVEAAVCRMTSNPAKRLGLKDRGILEVGFRGDIVVFDPLEIQDMSTFEQPHHYAKGVKYLVINGVLAIDDGQFTGEMAGKFISSNHKA